MFFLLLSMQDMSPSPMTLCPWWICGDCFVLFCFSPEHSLTVLWRCRHFTEGIIHFILRTILSKYWPQVYRLYGLQLFSKGTILWTLFFLLFWVALSKQLLSTQRTDRPLALQPVLVPYCSTLVLPLLKFVFVSDRYVSGNPTFVW